jgi:hypothetical protein
MLWPFVILSPFWYIASWKIWQTLSSRSCLPNFLITCLWIFSRFQGREMTTLSARGKNVAETEGRKSGRCAEEEGVCPLCVTLCLPALRHTSFFRVKKRASAHPRPSPTPDDEKNDKMSVPWWRRLSCSEDSEGRGSSQAWPPFSRSKWTSSSIADQRTRYRAGFFFADFRKSWNFVVMLMPPLTQSQNYFKRWNVDAAVDAISKLFQTVKCWCRRWRNFKIISNGEIGTLKCWCRRWRNLKIRMCFKFVEK